MDQVEGSSVTRHPIRLTERGEWVFGTLAGVIAIVGIPCTYLALLTLLTR